jgi:hypothetical protein
VLNLPDWAVAISHWFKALPDNFLVTEKISHRFIILPEVFLEKGAISWLCTTWQVGQLGFCIVSDKP